jgi:putative endonuclease
LLSKFWSRSSPDSYREDRISRTYETKLLIQVPCLPAGIPAGSKMITVYAIISEVNGDVYVGIAKDADQRLKEHNAGKNRYTKGLRPWKPFYRETQPNWEEARRREKYLKSGVGKEFLKKLVP